MANGFKENRIKEEAFWARVTKLKSNFGRLDLKIEGVFSCEIEKNRKDSR